MDNSSIQQDNVQGSNTQEKPKKKRRLFLWLFLILIIIISASIFMRTGMIFSVITGGSFWQKNSEASGHKHYSDPDRINILLLGIRGESDPNGGLLADTLILASIQKSSRRGALISIPRDIYVDIPDHNKREKINSAYAYGYERGGWQEALRLSKETVEDLIDVEIDYSAAVDFSAFKETIDTLGGIDVYVPWDFKETEQFSHRPLVFEKGIHHMDGETALYYVRSRYSTSDFDRARRQQDVLIAMKDKAFNIGVLTNPKKISGIIATIEKHIRTDVNVDLLQDFSQGIFLSLINSAKDVEIKRIVLDTSEGGYLESKMIDGIFYLVPRGGDTLPLQDAVKNIFR